MVLSMKNNNEVIQEFNDSLDLLKTLFKGSLVRTEATSLVRVIDTDGDCILAFNMTNLTTVATTLTSNQLECISDLMKIMYKLN